MNANTAGHEGSKEGTFGLTLGALGVVYGDIGTSPLYAFREAMMTVVHANGAFTPADVIGVISMILWALTLIVTLKYVIILLKVDNKGEGGPLALMTLVRSAFYGRTLPFLLIGMASTALFFGDSIITPAISVLSAVEGLKVATPALTPYVVPLALGIIFGLFLVQSRGTAKVSSLFGPVMAVWFSLLALTGAVHIGDAPQVLHALNPYQALVFTTSHGGLAFITLGAVFLAVTGAEALYTDLGHFGRAPIQLAWIWLVFPALALNYLGQGALVLKDPAVLANPFFRLVDPAHVLPLICVATMATVIASQAVITGAYSLARQAVSLGLLPRLKVMHTSDAHSGQIYMPQVNWMMMVGVLLLVLAFRSSNGLAAAYGISVAGAMLLDAVMIFFVMWKLKEWRPLPALALALPLILIDSMFLSSNLLKIADGGWMPLLVALLLSTIMVTWVQGTMILNSRAIKRRVKLDKFIKTFSERYGAVQRVPGTAVFMVSDPALAPAALVQNIKHNRVLHARNIILSVRIEPVPRVDSAVRSIVTRINENFSILVMRFGFMEHPDVQEELFRLNRDPRCPLDFEWEQTSLFISRRAVRSTPNYGLPMWQGFIFVWLSRNARDPSEYYRLPLGRVVEIGRHVII